MSRRADKFAGEPLGFDPVSLISLFLTMLPSIKALFAGCQTQPPVPPPVPAPLAAKGVTDETWSDSCGIKYAAEQSAGNGEEGFSRIAIRNATREIAKEKNVKRKAAKPMAIAALQTARDESAESLAETMQHAKNSEADLGGAGCR